MRILITNLHSALNLGDDAIMAATLAGLASLYPDAQITAAANDPASWRRYEQLNVVGSLCTWVADCRLGLWRRGLIRVPFVLLLLLIAITLYRLLRVRLRLRDPERRRLLDAYYEADLVLSCGGGNFYAHHVRSPALFWALTALAVPLGMGKPVVMLPQSVGPIEGRLQRTLARQIFRRIPLIMVREERSRRFLHDVLQVNKSIALLPDLAFDLPESVEAAEPVATGRPLRIGVTAIDRSAQIAGFGNQDEYEAGLVTALAEMQRRHSAAVDLLVQCYGPSADQDDRHVTARIRARLEQAGVSVQLHDRFEDAQALRRMLAEMDCLIATRMHTGIFAISSGVPLVMIAYQPKAAGLMASLGLDAYCLDIATITDDRLLEVVERMVANRLALRVDIATRYAALRPELRKWVQLLGEDAWRK